MLCNYAIIFIKKACFEMGLNLHIVTLDYKTLTLLLVKNEDEDFMLGGRGVEVEFCVFCDAIRV